MKILTLIPARMGSSRFPNKPMAKILGRPMIGHVFDNARKSKLITNLAVATCDHEISNYIKSIGGRAIMTSEKHERASDRCAEALEIIEQDDKVKYDIVVMIQGDEPMINKEMINQALKPMIDDPSILVTNLLGKIEDDKEFNDPNCIKVVCDLNYDALYFSRKAIPSGKLQSTTTIGKQICVIPFRRDFLLKYNSLDPTPLEISESIDMLRILEHGKKVRMVPTKHTSQAVDTKDDLVRVEKMLSEQ